MEQIGYSLIDANNVEVKFWGDTKGQCPGVPSMIALPNGDDVHCPQVGDTYGDWRLVLRMLDDSTPAGYGYVASSRTIAFDGEKTVVTAGYDRPISEEFLVAYAKDKRWQKEQGGFLFNGNMEVATDDRSQGKILGARLAAMADSTFTTPWVIDEQSFALDAPAIITMSDAVLEHVKGCFVTFTIVVAGIKDGSIATYEAVEAAFA